MTPHLNCTEGDIVFIRATVIEAASDFFKIRVEDYPNWVVTAYVPVSEIAKAGDILDLRAPRREDNGVKSQKLPK
jgi:hypothetical protein